MPDFAIPLRRAIAFTHGAKDRGEVYNRAREALLKELRDAPSVTSREITRQRLDLERAITEVEREAIAAFAVNGATSTS